MENGQGILWGLFVEPIRLENSHPDMLLSHDDIAHVLFPVENQLVSFKKIPLFLHYYSYSLFLNIFLQ